MRSNRHERNDTRARACTPKSGDPDRLPVTTTGILIKNNESVAFSQNGLTMEIINQGPSLVGGPVSFWGKSVFE
jgi:hypothetical protein